MDIIHESTEYDRFEQMDFNRNVVKTKDLKKLMEKYGFLSSKPLQVVKNGNDKFKIKDGHHRFYVARSLNLPLKYVVDDTDITMHELNKGTTPWMMKDYLESYVRMGIEDYRIVKNYCDETDISIQHVIAMFAGQAAGSTNFTQRFKDGTYKVNKINNHPYAVKDIVLYMKKCGIPFYSNSYFVCALSKILFVNEFSAPQLMSKVKKFTFLFTKQATIEQYIDLIDEVYNRQSKTKIPLKFRSEEEARKRDVCRK
jgi:hypothetical protein